MNADGVTSASMYIGPSGRPYVLCTTAASTERWRNGGEWSFCSPVILPPSQVPEMAIHDLDQLGKQQTLIAGAVSSSASIFAVLEKTGRIYLLKLSGHEDGGVCGQVDPPQRLPASLSEFSRVSTQGTTCLRFDPTGSIMYAISPKGRLIVVRFS